MPRIIPEGFTLLIGAPKAGKSWLALGVMLAAAAGGRVLGEQLTARPTLYLALEDSDRRLQGRAHVLGYGVSDAELLEGWSYTTRLTGEPASTVIRRWLDDLVSLDPAPLICVDTLGRVRGPRLANESPYDADYRIGAAMKVVADEIPGAALFAVHHDRKADASDWIDSVSGTHGLAGSADTIVVLRRERNSPEGVLLVTGRDVTEARYAVTFHDGQWSLNGGTWDAARSNAAQVAAVSGRGDTTQAIVAHITAVGAATAAEIATELQLDAATVRQSLQRLHDAELVERIKRGVYRLPLGHQIDLLAEALPAAPGDEL